ncbi:hypothetical protein V2J09_009093 [Rumex salicifolius]
MIDLVPKGPENRIHLFDPVGLINEKYSNYGVRPKQATTNGASGGLKFTLESKVVDTDSGGSSPRLWKPSSSNSPPASPRFTISPPYQLQNPGHHQHHHQSLEPMSPNSRTQAIARGRRELMEMIKDIPETYYDLSLRDIVEKRPHPPPPPPQPTATVEFKPSQESKKVEVVDKKLPPQQEVPKDNSNKKKKKEGKKKKVGKSESKKKMMKNRSVDNGGFLLKTTVFPIPFRSKRKKRSLGDAPSFKVAQKPSPKGGSKHWWVRKSRVSNETDNGAFVSADSTSTSRNSSIVSRHNQNNKFLPSCWSFFKEKRR